MRSWVRFPTAPPAKQVGPADSSAAPRSHRQTRISVTVVHFRTYYRVFPPPRPPPIPVTCRRLRDHRRRTFRRNITTTAKQQITKMLEIIIKYNGQYHYEQAIQRYTRVVHLSRCHEPIISICLIDLCVEYVYTFWNFQWSDPPQYTRPVSDDLLENAVLSERFEKLGSRHSKPLG